MNKPLPIQETLRASDFEWAQNWIAHHGYCQPVADEKLVKVMYSNGTVCDIISNACTWRVWTGGRDWWVKPKDERLHIVAYVVI